MPDTITVSGSQSNTVRVLQGSQPVSSVVVKKAADLTVQALKNVVSTDLQDGYTLIYDSDTGKFITSPIPAAIAPDTIDGGVF